MEVEGPARAAIFGCLVLFDLMCVWREAGSRVEKQTLSSMRTQEDEVEKEDDDDEIDWEKPTLANPFHQNPVRSPR